MNDKSFNFSSQLTLIFDFFFYIAIKKTIDCNFNKFKFHFLYLN